MNKNIVILIVSIIIFLMALSFFIYSSNENKNMEYEPKNIMEEKEISQTEDIEQLEYLDIKVYKEDGTQVNLSDFKDTSVMLLFWNPENEDSVTVLKKVNELYKKYDDKIKFLMITTSKEVPAVLKKEISIDIYYDLDKQVESVYNITKIPSMIYIYNDNEIINAKSGIPSTDALEANLDILSDNI